jgi:Domain of unknown function (DUF4389)
MLNPSSPFSSASATATSSTSGLLRRVRPVFDFWVIALDKCTTYTYSPQQSVRRTPDRERTIMESSGQIPASSPGDGPPGGGHNYPLTFSVEYPDRSLNRLSTAFRIFTIIPIAILAATLEGGSFGANAGGSGARYAGGGVGILVIPVLLMLLFRKKYPRWWYDWNLQLTRFTNRIAVYFALMDDRYPSTDEQQAVHLDFAYPDAEHDLMRGLPLIKWLLAIPHYIVLFFLSIGALFAAIGVWFAILFTGRYPRSLFDYIEGVIRWHNRVAAYAFLLITDRYPPFSLRS